MALMRQQSDSTLLNRTRRSSSIGLQHSDSLSSTTSLGALSRSSSSSRLPSTLNIRSLYGLPPASSFVSTPQHVHVPQRHAHHEYCLSRSGSREQLSQQPQPVTRERSVSRGRQYSRSNSYSAIHQTANDAHAQQVLQAADQAINSVHLRDRNSRRAINFVQDELLHNSYESALRRSQLFSKVDKQAEAVNSAKSFEQQLLRGTAYDLMTTSFTAGAHSSRIDRQPHVHPSDSGSSVADMLRSRSGSRVVPDVDSPPIVYAYVDKKVARRHRRTTALSLDHSSYTADPEKRLEQKQRRDYERAVRNDDHRARTLRRANAVSEEQPLLRAYHQSLDIQASNYRSRPLRSPTVDTFAPAVRTTVQNRERPQRPRYVYSFDTDERPVSRSVVQQEPSYVSNFTKSQSTTVEPRNARLFSAEQRGRPVEADVSTTRQTTTSPRHHFGQQSQPDVPLATAVTRARVERYDVPVPSAAISRTKAPAVSSSTRAVARTEVERPVASLPTTAAKAPIRTEAERPVASLPTAAVTRTNAEKPVTVPNTAVTRTNAENSDVPLSTAAITRTNAKKSDVPLSTAAVTRTNAENVPLTAALAEKPIDSKPAAVATHSKTEDDSSRKPSDPVEGAERAESETIASSGAPNSDSPALLNSVSPNVTTIGSNGVDSSDHTKVITSTVDSADKLNANGVANGESQVDKGKKASAEVETPETADPIGNNVQPDSALQDSAAVERSAGGDSCLLSDETSEDMPLSYTAVTLSSDSAEHKPDDQLKPPKHVQFDFDRNSVEVFEPNEEEDKKKNSKTDVKSGKATIDKATKAATKPKQQTAKKAATASSPEKATEESKDNEVVAEIIADVALKSKKGTEEKQGEKKNQTKKAPPPEEGWGEYCVIC